MLFRTFLFFVSNLSAAARSVSFFILFFSRKPKIHRRLQVRKIETFIIWNSYLAVAPLFNSDDAKKYKSFKLKDDSKKAK